MENKPISFEIDIESFDLSLLSIEPELLKNDASLLAQAISQYFSDYFARIGGQAQVAVTEAAVSVQWTPASSEDYERAFDEVIGLLRQNAYSTADPFMKALLGQFPDNPILLYNYGMALSEGGKLKDAIVVLEKAVEVDPENANALTALGVAFSRSGDKTRGMDAFQKSLRIDGGNGYAHRNLGALIAESDPKTALPHFVEAVKALPEDQQTQYGLATCLLALGQMSLADAALKKAIEIDPYGKIADFCRDHRTNIASHHMRASGDERPDVVMYCLAALRKFAEVGPSQRQTITFEIALLGQSGLDINNPDKKYTLKSMPGELTGMQLVSYMYVGFKQMDPSVDTGIDLSTEFKRAQEMFDRGG